MKSIFEKIVPLNLLTLIFILFALTPVWAIGPGEIVVQTIDRGIKVLENPELQGFSKFEERKQKLWEILTPVFDFEETAKRALGHHWKDRSPSEQTEFIALFTQVLRDIYLGKTDSYAGGQFIYVREIVKDDRGKVRTNFITTEQKKVVVDFSMQMMDSTWKVYDITIEGVSMVGNYRSQFNTIITSSSFESLMEKLRTKRDEFKQ